MEDMICNFGQESFQQAHAPMYDTLKTYSKKFLYLGCKNSLMLLLAVLSLVNGKARYGWSDKSYSLLLKVVHDMLLEENKLPKSYYQAEKILYRHEFQEMPKCPRCGVSRYKVKDDAEYSSHENSNKGPPVKVLLYLPIIPRFKHMFANRDDVKDLTWHADGRNCDGMLHHPADSSHWKKIDRLYPDFGIDARNLRLGLATDRGKKS